MLLPEVGHTQLIHDANRADRFATENEAQGFARHWRKKLWATVDDDNSAVHLAPSPEELRAIESGWVQAEREYDKGRRAEDNGDPQRAFFHYENAIDECAQHSLSLESLGKLTYAGHGPEPEDTRLSQATKWLQRALTLDPTLPDATLYMAMVYSRLDPNKTQGFVDRAVEADPCRTVSMARYAEKLSSRGYAEEAEDLFEKVLEKVPSKDSRRDHAVRAYARMLLDRPHGEERGVPKAIELLRQAVAMNPKDATNHFYLGLACSRRKSERAAAIGHLRESLRLRPDFEAATELLEQIAGEASTKINIHPHDPEHSEESRPDE